MNGDDAPALGSSFYSAALSSGFRLKRVDVFESPKYEFSYKIKEGDKVIQEDILFA